MNNFENTELYNAKISSQNPALIVILYDSSQSMTNQRTEKGETLAKAVTDQINNLLTDLVVVSTPSHETKNYFHVGVLRYGVSEDRPVETAFSGKLKGNCFNKIADIRKAAIIEGQKQTWVSPMEGEKTPTKTAFIAVAEQIAKWVMDHPNSMPPVVIHITDGVFDGDIENPLEVALLMKNALGNNHGNILLMNIHLLGEEERKKLHVKETKYPASLAEVPNDEFAKVLYEMSSNVPIRLVEKSNKTLGLNLTTNSKLYLFNASATELSSFFEIGTRLGVDNIGKAGIRDEGNNKKDNSPTDSSLTKPLIDRMPKVSGDIHV